MNIDFGTLFLIEWNTAFLLSILNILFINLILSGDNAVLIAMAVRNLPKNQRVKGIAFGSAVAILLRIIFTYFVALLLDIKFIKLIGGALILWIAVKLFTGSEEDGSDEHEATTLWHAIKIILIADFTMSLDNVLAVAGAAGRNLFLLMAGLVMGIPIVIFTSNLLSTLMDKYPIVIILGGAILGKVGGEMIITDPLIKQWLTPSHAIEYVVQAICAVGVVVVGNIWMKWKIAKAERGAEAETISRKAEVTQEKE